MNLLLCLAILAAVVVVWCTVPALWVVCHHNGAYQFHATRRLGALCLRTNYGYKVDFTTWQRPTLPVVCIAISALSWKEPQAATAN